MAEVRLELSEVMLAAHAGVLRRVSALKRQRGNAYGAGDMGVWDIDVEGACGEFAVAKYLGIFWNGTIGSIEDCDVGHYEVRTSKVKSAHLCLRPTDKPEARYVLAVGLAPTYRLCGWAYGREIMIDRYFDADGSRCKNKAATPMYWFPQSDLRPMATLVGDGARAMGAATPLAAVRG
jgi:hypothetical protein